MFSRLLAGSAVPADERSVLPTIRGVPWWGAVLIAVGATTLGAVISADTSSSLGRAFKVCYLLGCVLAALCVRQRALFTAAAQPPLVAFVVGIVTLYTLSSDSAQGMRDIVLKVILPIATSFPWILLAFVLTLAVVVARLLLARPQGLAVFGKFTGKSRPTTAESGRRAAPAKKTAPRSGSSGKTGSPKRAATPAAAGAQAKASATRRTGAAGTSATKRTATRDAAAGTQPKDAATRETRSRTAATKRVPAAAAAPKGSANAKDAATKRAATSPAAPRTAAASKAAPAKPAPQRAGGARPAAKPSADPAAAQRRPAAAQSPAPSPTRPAPRPRPAPAASPAAADAPRRRAAPQTIPPRDPKGRPRRTAGQLRDKSQIEDLTAGADER